MIFAAVETRNNASNIYRRSAANGEPQAYRKHGTSGRLESSGEERDNDAVDAVNDGSEDDGIYLSEPRSRASLFYAVGQPEENH